MVFLQLLLLFIFFTTIYYSGKFFLILKSGMCHSHYFLGFGSGLGEIKLSGIKFSIGILIPLFPFLRIYKIEDGKKERLSMSWEFINFPIWKRLIVTYGGIISLALAGIFILIVVAFTSVEQYISKEEVNRLGIYPSALGIKAGFKSGDKILLMNGRDYERFDQLLNLYEVESYRILRDNQTIDLTINHELIEEVQKNHEGLFSVDPPFNVGQVTPNSRAEQAGLKNGDKIVNVNHIPTLRFNALRNELLKSKENDALLTIERLDGSKKQILNLHVRPDENGRIGFAPEMLINYSKKENSLVKSVGIGIKNFTIAGYSTIKSVFRITSGEVVRSPISGPTGISQEFGSTWRFRTLSILTGYLAAVLVILNFLPLPKSCFRELIPLAYEGITKKIFPYKHFKKLTRLSYLLLAGLFLYHFILDFLKILGN